VSVSIARPAIPWSWRWYAWSALLLTASFAILPLFSSNQNHHFLIGLARAGEGWLADDWLVTTADPFPVFTAYVAFLHRHHLDALHQIVYCLLFGAYAYGLIRIVEHVQPAPASSASLARLTLLAALCVLHNETIGYLLGLSPSRLPWWQMTHWGFAEQEIFGHGAFQASSFGMLLPLAIACCLDGRRRLATLMTVGVVVLHFTYLMTGAAILAAFVFLENRDRGRTSALILVGIAAACLVPAAVGVVIRFAPTSAAASAAAAAALVQHLPQETIAARWFGWRAVLQIMWMATGIAAAAGTELLPILAAPFAAGAAVTAIQIVSGSPQLALLFPWRVSVLLVPIATALIVWKAVLVLLRASVVRPRIVRIASIAALAVSALIGAVRMALHFAYFHADARLTRSADLVLPPRWRLDFSRDIESDALPMMRFVRANAHRGDLYVIPPDLERFRLTAGVPVLADSKSHPYKDLEVLEWRSRLEGVTAMYASPRRCGALDALVNRYRVTHVLFRERRELSCAAWSPIYQDDAFTIYRFIGASDGTMIFSSR